MRKIKNIIGNKYGRYTVIGQYRTDGATMARCRCDCGTLRDVQATNLKSGNSKSCGCLKIEILRRKSGFSNARY